MHTCETIAPYMSFETNWDTRAPQSQVSSLPHNTPCNRTPQKQLYLLGLCCVLYSNCATHISNGALASSLLSARQQAFQ